MTVLRHLKLNVSLPLVVTIFTVLAVPICAVATVSLQEYCVILGVGSGANSQQVKDAFMVKAAELQAAAKAQSGVISAEDSNKLARLIEAFRALKAEGSTQACMEQPKALDLKNLSFLVRRNAFNPRRPLIAVLRNFYSADGVLGRASDFARSAGLPWNSESRGPIHQFLTSEFNAQIETAWHGLTGLSLDAYPGWKDTILSEFRGPSLGEALGKILARAMMLGLSAEDEAATVQELADFCAGDVTCLKFNNYKFFRELASMPKAEILSLPEATKAVVVKELEVYLVNQPAALIQSPLFSEILGLSQALARDQAKRAYQQCAVLASSPSEGRLDRRY